MYAVLNGDRSSSTLNCTDGSMYVTSDQFLNPVDETLKDLGKYLTAHFAIY